MRVLPQTVIAQLGKAGSLSFAEAPTAPRLTTRAEEHFARMQGGRSEEVS